MYVGDDEMNSFNAHNAQLLHSFLCLPHARGSDEAIAVKTQRLRERLTYRFLIIDDEDTSLRDIASPIWGSLRSRR
jgi:hypothetical protein